jgi:hypothetical protein
MKCLALVAIVIVGLAQQPTKAPAPVSSPQGQTNIGSRHTEDAEHTVGISKLPPVTVNPTKRDLADWGYWAFNLLLVLVGIAQVLLLRGTLKVIGRQTDIMDRQLSIPHRAYLAIGELAQPIGDEARFPMENYGHIAARITSVSVEVIVQSYPEGKEFYRRDLNKTANETVVPWEGWCFHASG